MEAVEVITHVEQALAAREALTRAIDLANSGGSGATWQFFHAVEPVPEKRFVIQHAEPCEWCALMEQVYDALTAYQELAKAQLEEDTQ